MMTAPSANPVHRAKLVRDTSVEFDDFMQAHSAGLKRTNLRFEVAKPLGVAADIREYQPH